MRVEFVHEHADILLCECSKQEHNLFNRMSGKSPIIAVFDIKQDLVAWAELPQPFVAALGKDVAEKFWYPIERSQHRIELYEQTQHNDKSTESCYLLWWVLDELHYLKKNLLPACEYAEKKIIEYALERQKEAA